MVGAVGLLVEPGDYKEIAQRLIKVLSDDLLRKEMGRGAKKRAEAKYNWTQTAENMLNVYEYSLSQEV